MIISKKIIASLVALTTLGIIGLQPTFHVSASTNDTENISATAMIPAKSATVVNTYKFLENESTKERAYYDETFTTITYTNTFTLHAHNTAESEYYYSELSSSLKSVAAKIGGSGDLFRLYTGHNTYTYD